MQLAAIKELYEATPFEPFEVVLPNGSTLKIDHPEFVSFSRDRRTLHFWEPSGRQKWVDIKLITALNKAAPANKKTRRKAS